MPAKTAQAGFDVRKTVVRIRCAAVFFCPRSVRVSICAARSRQLAHAAYAAYAAYATLMPRLRRAYVAHAAYAPYSPYAAHAAHAPLMHYWLMKSEPDDVSFDDVMAATACTLAWFGVRNYQARNFMRDQMAAGDGVLF